MCRTVAEESAAYRRAEPGKEQRSLSSCRRVRRIKINGELAAWRMGSSVLITLLNNAAATNILGLPGHYWLSWERTNSRQKLRPRIVVETRIVLHCRTIGAVNNEDCFCHCRASEAERHLRNLQPHCNHIQKAMKKMEAASQSGMSAKRTIGGEIFHWSIPNDRTCKSDYLGVVLL